MQAETNAFWSSPSAPPSVWPRLGGHVLFSLQRLEPRTWRFPGAESCPWSRPPLRRSHSAAATGNDMAGHRPIFSYRVRPFAGLQWRDVQARLFAAASSRNPGQLLMVRCAPGCSSLMVRASNGTEYLPGVGAGLVTATNRSVGFDLPAHRTCAQIEVSRPLAVPRQSDRFS